MINDLAEFISIDSTLSEPSICAPFGIGARDTLLLFLEKAKQYGLRTGNADGYAGWAEYGDGKNLVGILAHLDVVPAVSGWTTPPFTLTTLDGMLYGRGVSDDKGPLVACLHALRRLADEKANLGARVRLIVGLNEESGSECIKHYVRTCEVPVVAFTPDSDFPVVASEKGIAHLKIILPVSEKIITDFLTISGGERPNIVPNSASFTVKRGSDVFALFPQDNPTDVFRKEKVFYALADGGIRSSDFDVVSTEDGLTVVAHGVSAHGSTPQKGDNAVRKCLSLLGALTGDESIVWAYEHLTDNVGKSLDISCSDETGALTLNLGQIDLVGNALHAVVDLRMPKCLDYGTLRDRLDKALPTGASVEELHYSPCLSYDENDKLVSTLLDVYRKTTGDTQSVPLHIGGGTYAKELPNCVGFGAVFPNQDTHMHEADECYPVSDLYRLVDIYYEAIKALCREYKDK